MSTALVGDALATAAALVVAVWSCINFTRLFRDLSPRLERIHRVGRPLLPATAGLIAVGCALSGRGAYGALGVVATLVLWITGGGGKGMWRVLDWCRGVVTRHGNRLVVEDS